MSVVSERVIFCEGKQSSLDYQLLDRIVKTISDNNCTIASAGSKFTFSIFAQGYFFPDEITNQKYIVFRDRDFDTKPTENIRLLELVTSGNKVLAYLTHRTCLENYLLDPNLIDSYWREKYTEKIDNPISKWGHGNSPGVEAISMWIESSAKDLQFYQAVRWALGDLLGMTTAREQLKTTWTGASGELPKLLDLQSCHSEALELINQFKEAVSSVTPENFEASLNSYQQLFTQEDFWTQKST